MSKLLNIHKKEHPHYEIIYQIKQSPNSVDIFNRLKAKKAKLGLQMYCNRFNLDDSISILKFLKIIEKINNEKYII